MAVEKGLEMAVSLGIPKLMLQMDNQACLDGLRNPEYHGGECFHILNNCRRLINSFGCNFRLFHCYREGNKVADKLANIGVDLEEDGVIFNTPPPFLGALIHEDIVGVTTPRLVI